MAIARRVFTVITAPVLAASTAGARNRLDYIRDAFELAALLHDVGHCAFSHSIEQVRIEGGPFLGTLRQFLGNWEESALADRYVRHYRDAADKPITHEQVGLALVARIFRTDSVKTVCKSRGYNPDELCVDVQSLMDGGLPTSASWKRACLALAKPVSAAVGHGALVGDIDTSHLAEDLATVLHQLVSGTLDVDRLDYLNRDSFFCGVTYGHCQADFLIASLRVGGVGGRLTLMLSEKAVSALDDMLWSRYQLFVQVLNHKTNVGLNAVLSDAITDAIRDARFERPKTYEAFLGFTDDFVMSRIFSACLQGKLAERSYAKALIDRTLPFHLRAERVGADTTDRTRTHKLNRVKKETKLDDVFFSEARSELIKPGPLPIIVGRDRVSGGYTLARYPSKTTVATPGPSHHVLHFFADRQQLQGGIQ